MYVYSTCATCYIILHIFHSYRCFTSVAKSKRFQKEEKMSANAKEHFMYPRHIMQMNWRRENETCLGWKWRGGSRENIVENTMHNIIGVAHGNT